MTIVDLNQFPETHALDELLGLYDVGCDVREARIYGTGSRAAVEIDINNGATMAFDEIREMANPNILAAELVACTGATPKITKREALQAVALTRKIASQHSTATANDTAVDWGVDYLGKAQIFEADLSDQAQRWRAFCEIDLIGKEHSPFISPAPYFVVRHVDGNRLVRASWFTAHVKHIDNAGAREIPVRMIRVGWQRKGRDGRVKATRPDLPGQHNWAFYFVPEGWEDRGSGSEVTAGVGIDARTQVGQASRVDTGTCRNPVTGEQVAR